MAKPLPVCPGAKAREQARQASFWVQPVAPPIPPPMVQGNGRVQGGGSPRGVQLFVWAFAVTLLILVIFAVIFLVAHALLSAGAPPAASLLPAAWLWQGGAAWLWQEGNGVRAVLAVFV